jgi:hypothetical protein
MVWPCKVGWSVNCLQLCSLICTNFSNTNIGNTQVTNTYRGLVQIVRSKLDSLFSLAILFHSHCTKNFSCRYAVWKCRNVPKVVSVHIRLMPLHMRAAGVYLVVMQHAQNGKKNCRLYFDMTNYHYLLSSSKTH